MLYRCNQRPGIFRECLRFMDAVCSEFQICVPTRSPFFFSTPRYNFRVLALHPHSSTINPTFNRKTSKQAAPFASACWAFVLMCDSLNT